MKFDVIGYSNEVMGEVEASNVVEAWSEAGKKFSNILDVRQVEEPKYGKEEERQYREEEHYREKGFRIVHAGVVESKKEPKFLYHASRRGDLYRKGIEPSIAGVIMKDPEGAKIFMSASPEEAVGSVLSEERLKAEQGVLIRSKGDIIVYQIKLPEGSFYRDPRSGDYIIKRPISPDEIVGWKSRSQIGKFIESDILSRDK